MKRNPTNKKVNNKINKYNKNRELKNYRFKYGLLINQWGAIRLMREFPEVGLDPVDLFIFSFIYEFISDQSQPDLVSNSKNSRQEWFWVSDELIMRNLPILPMTSLISIRVRVNKLNDAKVIKLHPANQHLRKKQMRLGERSSYLTERHENYRK